MGGRVFYIGGLSLEGGKYCFLIITCEFCSSNALYSASLSFRIFILTF